MLINSILYLAAIGNYQHGSYLRREALGNQPGNENPELLGIVPVCVSARCEGHVPVHKCVKARRS